MPNIRDADGNIRTDFEKAFRDGYQFQYNLPYDGPQTVEFTTQSIGELVLPSGQLIACDPLLPPDLRYCFTQTVKPGRYPVVLSLAGFKPRQDRRIDCAMLQVSQQMPVRWELAILNSDGPANYQNYGVDSGTGSFMDAEVAQILKQMDEPDPDEYTAAWQESREAAWALQRAASDRFENEYCQPVVDEMESNGEAAVSAEYPYDRKGDWANFCINKSTGANVIAFGSGWEDGGYASYWGYDDNGQIVCIVTDFRLFGFGEGEDD
ncbi:DUF4241 domain-containing protein [Nodosilinea sp. FACHB-13]|uniref:DUF4241 domain-containing protein n=1 Tax=Cyanophyceae TaxID=3028117 RepID=UPI0016861A08|nr:DUF4241 domain-containing protein [Nodosilinea sp. FACHB-13]MBD2105684.1 DUF4241 domain-containing protein [Nodosilinea sp. FACHB-13]